MKAKEIYDSINENYQNLRTGICQLHKPCSIIRKCDGSHKEVIDFDRVERLYHKGASSPLPSVDAITYNDENTCFCFVEIKGWERFLSYQLGTLKEEDKEKEIKRQAYKYDLKGKLENSLALCQEVTGDKDCFKTDVEVVYVLVTDIEVRTNPLESIAYNLNILAASSSKWEDLCNKYLSQAIEKVSDVRKIYIHCKEFDALMRKL